MVLEDRPKLLAVGSRRKAEYFSNRSWYTRDDIQILNVITSQKMLEYQGGHFIAFLMNGGVPEFGSVGVGR